MKYVFPAKIQKEGNGYFVCFPDIKGCFTSGDTLTEAVEMAQDVLATMLSSMEDDGYEIPSPSDLRSLDADEDELLTLVYCDTSEARKNAVACEGPDADILREAILLASDAHKGQFDKSGKDYYSEHILPVAAMAQQTGVPYADIVAILHDILEDTAVTVKQLMEKFPDEVVNAVITLTHQPGEVYFDYICRIKDNPLARTVKICDLQSNMCMNRLPCITREDQKRQQKYAEAYLILTKDFL